MPGVRLRSGRRAHRRLDERARRHRRRPRDDLRRRDLRFQRPDRRRRSTRSATWSRARPAITASPSATRRRRSRSCSRNARYLLPVHDRPAKIEHGMVVGAHARRGARPGGADAAEAQLVPGVTRAETDDPHARCAPSSRTDRRLRAGRPARHRLHLHRRADLASGRALSPVLRHAGRRAAALGRARRRARGARGRRTSTTA